MKKNYESIETFKPSKSRTIEHTRNILSGRFTEGSRNVFYMNNNTDSTNRSTTQKSQRRRGRIINSLRMNTRVPCNKVQTQN